MKQPIPLPSLLGVQPILRQSGSGCQSAEPTRGAPRKVDERHLILILEFATDEDADRIAREVGGPWMREHIRQLLAGDTGAASRK